LILIIDTVKAEEIGVSPRQMKRLKDHCQAEGAAADEARYLWPDGMVGEILDMTKQAMTRAAKMGKFTTREGRAAQKHYDIRKLLKLLWKSSSQEQEDTEQKIKEERLKELKRDNDFNSGLLVDKQAVTDAVTVLLKSVGNMFKYQIKSTAPLMVGSRSASDNEKIMRMKWNGIMKVVEEHADDKTWLDSED